MKCTADRSAMPINASPREAIEALVRIHVAQEEDINYAVVAD